MLSLLLNVSLQGVTGEKLKITVFFVMKYVVGHTWVNTYEVHKNITVFIML